MLSLGRVGAIFALLWLVLVSTLGIALALLRLHTQSATSGTVDSLAPN